MTDRLPPILCNEMLAAVYQQRMQHIPIFKYIPCKSVAVYLFQLLQPSFLEPNSYVITEGTTAECLHFLVTGEAVVFKYKYKSFLPQASNANSLDGFKPDKRSKLQKRVTISAPIERIGSTRSVQFNASSMFKDDRSEGLTTSRRASFKPNLTINLNESFESPRLDSNAAATQALLAPGSTRNFASSLFGTIDEDLNKLDIELVPITTREASDYSPINQDDVSFLSACTPNEAATTQPDIKSLPSVPTPKTRKSFIGSSLAALAEGISSPSNQGTDKPDAIRRGSMFTLSTFSTPKDNVDPLFASTEKSVTKMTASDFDKLQLRYLGTIGPGDFVGHGSYLQQRSTHLCSVKTTLPSTVFLLPKVDILRLIRDEPSVGIQLQSALIQSIRGQKDWLGRLHRKANRAHFLQDMRDEHTERRSKFGIQEVARKRTLRQRNLANSSRNNSSAGNNFNLSRKSAHSSFSHAMLGGVSLPDATASGKKVKEGKKSKKPINLHNSKRLWYDSDDEKEKIKSVDLLASSSAYYRGRRKMTKPFSERALSRLKRIKAFQFFFGKEDTLKGPKIRSCSIADFEDYCVREGLEVEKAMRNRQRRQTFPSLDIQHWKEKKVKEGVI